MVQPAERKQRHKHYRKYNLLRLEIPSLAILNIHDIFSTLPCLQTAKVLSVAVY